VGRYRYREWRPHPTSYYPICYTFVKLLPEGLVAAYLLVDEVGEQVSQYPFSEVDCGCQYLQAAQTGKKRTSLVFPELHGQVQVQLIGVHLGIETVVGFQHDRQVPRANID
jgi:hypothetical protein